MPPASGRVATSASSSRAGRGSRVPTRGPSATQRGATSDRKRVQAQSIGYEKLRISGVKTLTFPQQKCLARAESLNIPPHLCLGLTIGGLRETFAELPAAAAAAAASRAVDAVRPPTSSCVSGWDYQQCTRVLSRTDGLSACERLQKSGSKHVGVASVFVTWQLGSQPETLLAALDNLIESTTCDEQTVFWVRDLSIRQSPARASKDLDRLKDVVAAIGQTVLLLERLQLVCQSPPLRCAYCLSELAYSAHYGVPFHIIMTDPDEEVLHLQLLHHFDLFAVVLAGPSARVVNSRRSTCRRGAKHEEPDEQQMPQMLDEVKVEASKGAPIARRWEPNDATRLKEELGKTIGWLEANEIIVGLLMRALMDEGRTALSRLPAEERASSKIALDLARVLERREDRDEAIDLLQAAVEASRIANGDGHPHVLERLQALGAMLTANNQLPEAAALLHEAFTTSRANLGDLHPATIDAMEHVESLGIELYARDELQAASTAFRAGLEFHRKNLGDQHPRTLGSIFNLGMLLKKMSPSSTDEARCLLTEAVDGARITFGETHARTAAFLDGLSHLGDGDADADTMDAS